MCRSDLCDVTKPRPRCPAGHVLHVQSVTCGGAPCSDQTHVIMYEMCEGRDTCDVITETECQQHGVVSLHYLCVRGELINKLTNSY